MSAIETISEMHSPRPSFGRLWNVLGIAIGNRVALMAARHRSRQALMELPDELLKDIGISRSEAYREGIRPFWD